MGENDPLPGRAAQRTRSHMPEHSVFYEKVIPILLIALGVVMVALVLFAAGVVLGVVKF